MTIDGQRYDFHAVGEFVGARSTVDDLELQLRFGPYGDKDRVTTTTAVAARVGDARISVVHGRDPLLWVDGAPAPLESGSLSLGGGASIAKTRNGYEIVWPDGSTSTVDSFRHYLNAYFSPAQSHRGKIVGLLGDFDGNPDNDLVTSAGERIQRPHRFGDIYGKYAPTWRVSQEESLFDYGPGETTETFTDLDYPAGAAAIAQLSTQERQQATEICKSAGVTDLEVLDDCIFDVGYTGVEEFAESASTVQARVEADARRTLQWFDGVSIAAATSGTASFPFAVHVRGAATKDYRVVIAPVGSKAGTSVGHNALRGGEQIVKIDLPRESGSYELRYETKVRPYETRHRQPLTVTAPVARIEAPDVAPAGSRLAMSCVGDCSPNANLAVVPVGTPDQKQGSHHGFMSGGPDVTIRLPEAPGAYEIRYVTRTLPRKVFARKPLTLE